MYKWILDIPFELRQWAGFKKIKWMAEEKVFYFEAEELPEEFALFRPKAFSYSWNKERKINKTKKFPELATPFWHPREHQSIASQMISAAYKAKLPGFLLADDVGLGKTVSAWDFVREEKNFKNVLIVCPVSVIPHWRNTILHTGHAKKEILIINYESLSKIFEEKKGKSLSSTRAKGKQKRIAKELEAPAYDVIIWDESHKCKNQDNARSKMAQKLRAKTQFSIWLSATAGQTPLELSYLSTLLTKQTGIKVSTSLDFEIWCQKVGLSVERGNFGKWIWNYNEEDAKKINSWLFGGKIKAGIRRTPVEIAGWKELQRDLYPVDLSINDKQIYEESWNIFRHKEMGERLTKTKASESILIKSLRFRQKSSWLRIENTVELIEEYLENNIQIAVSVAFVETLNQIADLLEKKKVKVSRIHGSLSSNAKEEERLAFQRGENQVVLFTVEEGISLHEGEHNEVPRVLLIHDIRWSAIQMAQIEGRCHRDGKFAPAIWLYCEDTIEYKIAGLLIQKIKGMKKMLGDDIQLLKEIEELLLKQHKS